MGQFLRKRFMAGLLVFLLVVTPLIWLGFLLNHRVFIHVLRSQGQGMPLLTDWTFLQYMAEPNVMAPIHYTLALLALGTYLAAAIHAARDTPTTTHGG